MTEQKLYLDATASLDLLKQFRQYVTSGKPLDTFERKAGSVDRCARCERIEEVHVWICNDCGEVCDSKRDLGDPASGLPILHDDHKSGATLRCYDLMRPNAHQITHLETTIRGLMDLAFAEPSPRVIDLTPLDWDRIDAGDQAYLGKTLYRAFHERLEHPDRFAVMVGLVAGTLCAEAATK